MTILSRDQILNASDLTTTEVDVPEWGGKVRVRVLSGYDRDQLEGEFTAAAKGVTKPNFRARFAVLVICDEKGHRILDDKDVAAMGKRSSAALDRVMDAGIKLNRMSKEDVSQLAGESAGDLSSASGSGSPSPSV